jgi:hypothetical protein|tara:strand:- start:299 stop:466 length:168 start_codon:yes stop_codon:yes gene_type:complete
MILGAMLDSSNLMCSCPDFVRVNFSPLGDWGEKNLVTFGDQEHLIKLDGFNRLVL